MSQQPNPSAAQPPVPAVPTAGLCWLNVRRRCRGFIRWVIRCLPFSGRRFGEIDEKSQHTNLEGLVALFAFMVTQVGAGLFFTQQRDYPPGGFTAYLILGSVTLIAMGIVIGSYSTDEAKGVAMYAHDRGTVVVGKWLVACSAALLVLFVGGGYARILPGQGTEDLRIMQARYYEQDSGYQKEVPVDTAKAIDTPDGLPWISLDVPIRPDQFGGKIPTQFELQFTFKGKLEDWCTIQAQLFRITPEHYKERIMRYSLANPSVNTVEVNVPTPEDKYVLEVYIEQKYMDGKPIDVGAIHSDTENKETRVKELVDARSNAIASAMGDAVVELRKEL